MNRKAQIQRQIAKLEIELAGLAPMDSMGVRELARAAGVSPTTAMRAKRGDILSKAVIEKLLPFMAECPCCGQSLNTNQ